MSYVLYGGLFDPPHAGHLSIAIQAYRHIEPDMLIWLPSGNPQHRQPGHIDVKQRYDMLEWWINLKKTDLNMNFEVSDIECRSGHDGYSITSVMYFKSRYPGQKQYFLVGSDEAVQLKNWYEWEKLIENTNLIVADRGGDYDLPAEIAQKSVILENDIVSVSSTWIREHLQEKNTVGKYMDAELLGYIRDKSLYR